jgi:hypothetical protein
VYVQHIPQQEAHCGPATVAMLFSFYGLPISQQDISDAAGMAESIVNAGGMRLDELNDGVTALYPDGEYVLLAKYGSSIEDLSLLTQEFDLPVGVEWQGHFPQPDGSYADQGHYSIITAVDQKRGILEIVDPEDRNTLTTNGTLAIDEFEERWWEIDIMPQPHDWGITKVIETERLAFIIVPQEQSAVLRKYGFRPAELALTWEYCTLLEPGE